MPDQDTNADGTGAETSPEAIRDALRSGDNAEALRLARAHVVADQDSAAGYRLLAMALRASGETDAALSAIDRAIALAPDDADLYFHRAGYLLGAKDIAAAEAELSKSVQLDPNQFGAYVMQAQLAFARGATDEGERITRLAARVAPEHPWTAVLESTAALQRGDADRALRLLISAVEAAPDDSQVRYALGFAYMKKGHLAFAEQAFRGVVESSPGAVGMWGLVAELIRQQGRPDEAAEVLAPLLADASATPGLHRFAGELQMAAGRPELAQPHLLRAFSEQPGDGRALAGLMHLWQRDNDQSGARTALDAALAHAPHVDRLWQARLVVEGGDTDAALDVVIRWQSAMPDSVAAFEAKMGVMIARGDVKAAEATAQEIVRRVPGHGDATMQIVDGLVTRDPEAAIAYIDTLLPEAQSTQSQRVLRAWRGTALDRAGRHAEAVETWVGLHAEVAADSLPLPEPTAPRKQWPPMAEVEADALAQSPAVAFLVGAPGSGVEGLAAVLAGTVDSFRADRFGATPPDDGLQNYRTMPQLASGEADVAAIAARWRDALPARGSDRGEIIDWLLWWDNALLAVLRDHLPQASLIIAIRDPRDMLLQWLAHGAHAQFRVESASAAAGWLAIALNQVALLHEQALFSHTLVRMDGIDNDGPALAQALCDALQTPLPPPPEGRFGAPRFAAGYWRHYRDALAEPFALLTPVARRLGYPDD